jgi:hypothetical protein
MSERPFSLQDGADKLHTKEDIIAYFEAVMETGGDDPAYIAQALEIVGPALEKTAFGKELLQTLGKALGDARIKGPASIAAFKPKQSDPEA